MAGARRLSNGADHEISANEELAAKVKQVVLSADLHEVLAAPSAEKRTSAQRGNGDPLQQLSREGESSVATDAKVYGDDLKSLTAAGGDKNSNDSVEVCRVDGYTLDQPASPMDENMRRELAFTIDDLEPTSSPQEIDSPAATQTVGLGSILKDDFNSKQSGMRMG